MSYTGHEVGHVPSTIDNADPLVDDAPKHISLVAVAVISFLFPPAGLIMAARYNKEVTAHNAQAGATKVSSRNYWLTVGISAAIAMMAVVATQMPQNNPANSSYIVIGTGPVATPVLPSPAAPIATVQAPEPVVTTPVVANGPIEPVATTPEGIVRAVEAYRNKALSTGDIAPLAQYYARGALPQTEYEYQSDVAQINRWKDGLLAGKITETITKIEMVSVTPTKMVANVTIKTTVIGMDSGTTTSQNWYVIVGDRWLVSANEPSA